MPKRDLNALFDILSVPLMKRNNITGHTYRVYKNPEEYETVEAETAKDAIEKANVDHVHKVVLEHLRMGNIIQKQILEKEGDIFFSLGELEERFKKAAPEPIPATEEHGIVDTGEEPVEIEATAEEAPTETVTEETPPPAEEAATPEQAAEAPAENEAEPTA